MKEDPMSVIEITILVMGIILGAAAAVFITNFVYRMWLKNLMTKLSEKLQESDRYYMDEGLYRTRSEQLVWDIHRTVENSIERPDYFWSTLNELFNSELYHFVNGEFEYRRIIHLLRKQQAKLADLQKKLPADNHLLLTALHYMSQMSPVFQMDVSKSYSVAAHTRIGIPQVAELISEMEKSLGEKQSKHCQ
jgi:hypothetical protein